MPGSGVIDLAVGVVIVIGVAAAVSSAATELIARLLGLRGTYFLRGLSALLDGDGAEPDLAKAACDYDAMRTLMGEEPTSSTTDSGVSVGTTANAAEPGPASVTGALLGSPILRSQGMTGQIFSQKLMMRPAGRGGRLARMAASAGRHPWRYRRGLPTYIPARSFAGALIDMVVPDASGQPTMDTIQHSVALMPDSMSVLRGSLRALATSAGSDIGLFRASVERWYDDHMDRVTGWYKRHVAKITLVVGAILVLLLNINTLTIGRTLYNSSTTLAAMNAVVARSDLCPAGLGQRACLTNLQAQLSPAVHSGLPIGWGIVADCAAPKAACNWLDQRGIFSRHGNSGWQVILILIGFLITIVMLVPGARFWFDLLGRLGTLRSGKLGILPAVSVAAPQPEPEPSATGAGTGGTGSTPPPPVSGPNGFFEWFRRVLAWLRRVGLRWLARRNCNITGFVDQRTADDAARARRRRVQQALFGAGQPIRLELPDDLSPYGEAEEIPRHEAAARQVTLEWQLSEPELLLLARVCDTVEALMRRLDSRAGQSELPPEERDSIRKPQLVVTLQPVPKAARRLAPDTFPWRVVVKTNDPAILTGMLREYADWYGVGVHVMKGKPVKRAGGCVHGGMDGTIGGIVQIGNESYGLTCAHVVGAGCPSISTPVKEEDDVWSPDAVLLKLDGPCLAAPEEPWRPVSPVSWAETRKLVKARAVACMRTARGRLRTGNMQSPTLLVGYDDGAVEFPTIEIQRTPGPYPPRPFSKSGDSGTWVTLQDAANHWVGMVVGGNPGGNTYCHLSGPLLRWLEILLSNAPRPPVEEEDWFKGENKILAVAKMSLSGGIKNEQH